MPRIAFSISLTFGIFAAVPCAAEDPDIVAFADTSNWLRGAHGDGAELVRAGRTAAGIVVEGSGAGVLSTPWSYCYAAQTTNIFDRSITARLESYDGPAGGSAGISIREFSDDARSTIFMDLIYTPDGRLHHQAWTWSGLAATSSIAQISLPVWLQIEYRGGGLFAHWSSDGETWQEFGDYVPGTLPPEARPMLTVASGSAAENACAHFDGIWISGGDADDNDIYDGWEIREFGRLVGDDAQRDLDGDTVSVRDEWLTGASPSVFELPRRLSILRNDEGEFEVSLEGTPTLWQLQATDSLDAPWEVLQTNFGTRARVFPVDGKPARFYRAAFPQDLLNDPMPFELASEQ